jgi:hypothetical protein
MYHSIYSADRTTHLKVVIVALIAGILVAGFGISMRNSSDEGLTQTARVMKAGKRMVTTSNKSVNRSGGRNHRITGQQDTGSPEGQDHVIL